MQVEFYGEGIQKFVLNDIFYHISFFLSLSFKFHKFYQSKWTKRSYQNYKENFTKKTYFKVVNCVDAILRQSKLCIERIKLPAPFTKKMLWYFSERQYLSIVIKNPIKVHCGWRQSTTHCRKYRTVDYQQFMIFIDIVLSTHLSAKGASTLSNLGQLMSIDLTEAEFAWNYHDGCWTAVTVRGHLDGRWIAWGITNIATAANSSTINWHKATPGDIEWVAWVGSCQGQKTRAPWAGGDWGRVPEPIEWLQGFQLGLSQCQVGLTLPHIHRIILLPPSCTRSTTCRWRFVQTRATASSVPFEEWHHRPQPLLDTVEWGRWASNTFRFFTREIILRGTFINLQLGLRQTSRWLTTPTTSPSSRRTSLLAHEILQQLLKTSHSRRWWAPKWCRICRIRDMGATLELLNCRRGCTYPWSAPTTRCMMQGLPTKSPSRKNRKELQNFDLSNI